MIIEGLLPLISPKTWKNLIKIIFEETDMYIRISGFFLIVLGSSLIYLAKE